VGYPRAARMIEMMEEDGIVGPAAGGKPRDVLGRKNEQVG
jgi:S-DNA-T family DNA segregation ATPase FtsK/SpoIIIE